jgi:proteasome lid subunit RPN8/RPN11
MIVEIASRVRETLLAEAVAAAGDECCGLLLGAPGRITALVPARNVAADPARSFEIEPATLLRTHREARGGGEQVVGHYHSHPNGRPEPSLRDAARAVGNGEIWLIIAAGTLNGWAVVGNDHGGSAVHGRFLPVTLVAA